MKITSRHHKLIKHALGIDFVNCFSDFCFHFIESNNHPDFLRWEDMVKEGYARKRDYRTSLGERGTMFRVTAKGKALIA